MTNDIQSQHDITAVARIADDHARGDVFSDYQRRHAANTNKRHRAALDKFAEFLALTGVQRDALMDDPAQWHGITWGLVEAFRNWLVKAGYAVGTVNGRLSSVKTYSRLATKAGVIPQEDYAMIKLVAGYTDVQGQRIDEHRDQTRASTKKAEPVALRDSDAVALKDQPPTPQGARDTVIMCLLLDHALRVSELAALRVGDIDFERHTITIRRQKTNTTDIHEMSDDTIKALREWRAWMPDKRANLLLRSTNKRGQLAKAGMGVRAIRARVEQLGEVIGIEGLSPHDCRHWWATYWANRVPLPRLMQAGGWRSPKTALGYVNAAEIANEGMTSTED